MAPAAFDITTLDAQAMPAIPVEPGDFDYACFADHAAAADARYAAFLHQPEGIAVWQRVRVADVFRDGCRDMAASLRSQLGGLMKSLAYATDAPNYLEPWYGIGTTAAAFGGEYDWPAGQAPVVRPQWPSVADAPALAPRPFAHSPIVQHTLKMIEYFLDQTGGRLPMSWCDIQNPLNVATELVDTSGFFAGFVEQPERVQQILAAVTDVIIAFTQQQTELIGPALVRPGHGFASSHAGIGIGMSSDNLVMISPRMFERFCLADCGRIGAAFGGAAIHSCGAFVKWLPALKKVPNLVMVDAAFSPQTDPDPNECEPFRDAFVNTGVIVHARMVGDPDDVLARVKRLWTPGVKLIVVTYVQEPAAQRQLYRDLHRLCE